MNRPAQAMGIEGSVSRGLMNNRKELNLKPPLKWAGGKRWLVPRLQELWQLFPRQRLVEPFCGGLAVTLGLKPDQALLNDINRHLINFFKQVQEGLPRSLVFMNDEELYYQNRERFNALIKAGEGYTREGAELFYYLNRTGFNGLCRFNKKDEFNVPFGRYKSIPYLPDFTPYQEAFHHWEFTCTDFVNVPLKDDDFVYCDPPYDVDFTSYAKEGFSWEDQVRLVKWLLKHRGPVVLSNQATPRIIKLYSDHDFSLTYLDAPRKISCTGDRTPAREVLATRNIPLCR